MVMPVETVCSLSMLWANSADDKLKAFFLFCAFHQQTGFDISCLQNGEYLHKMSRIVFLEE